jgi:pimeloyl-ACP methyl ester carboxylesterase
VINREQISIAADAPPGACSATWYTAGWLTCPDQLSRCELQVLVHGAGADHRYWDWPTEPETYSYVEWAAARGLATLSIDRIGAGWSSKPPGTENTIAAQARTLSQIVAQARLGLAGAPPFERVVLVGASLGSVVSGFEAATYADVDAVVLTAYLPVDGTREAADNLFDAAFMPATEGLPHLLGLVPDDYLTTRPMDQEAFLYWSDQADPTIVSLDKHFKGTTNRSELYGAAELGATIRTATAPVLVLVGQHDVLLIDPGSDKDGYDAVRRIAAQSPGNFDFEVIPETGHTMNLHRTAHTTFETIDRWLTDRAALPTVA